MVAVVTLTVLFIPSHNFLSGTLKKKKSTCIYLLERERRGRGIEPSSKLPSELGA